MARTHTTVDQLDALVSKEAVVDVVLTRSGNVHVESARITEVRDNGEFDVVYDEDGELIEDTLDLCFYHVVAR